MTDTPYGPGPGDRPDASDRRPQAPQPGVIPLRPLQLGDIASGAVTYIRQNPAVLLLAAGITAIGQLATVLVTALFGAPAATPELTGVGITTGGTGGVAFLVSAVTTAVLNGMLVIVLSRAVLGHRMPLSEAWTAVRPRLLGLIGLSLLVSLIVSAAFLVAFAPFVLAPLGGVGTGTLRLLLIPVAIVVAVYLAVLLVFASPAYVLERVGVGQALGRSRTLVRGAWWRIFGTLVLVGLGFVLVALVVGIPFAFLIAGVAEAGSATAAVVNSLGTIVVSAIASPLVAGVVGLLYFDQRIRKERFDEELARSAGLR